ncbi:AmmeMemoRadiSam system protein B [uncultured Thiohalocapsa sp.]|uniref:AmmeMemoRadiSam system protein B n=1 Tax=uncultured Thiohalocapsa sp. TaxID=768990 RepID=UPI0025DCB6B5|nr:AmmeMemoRadiSam system protein B [uncultured Thiohalocapsa sp.]
MSNIRRPAVAGLFYPDDPGVLHAAVTDLLTAARPAAAERAPQPKALIAPHAGYAYSGAIAASAYAQLTRPDLIRRVLLLGPAHRLPFRGIAVPTAEQFATPLGGVAVDRGALASLTGLPQVHELDMAFDGEHCLEVQLPFLQAILGHFSIVPLLVGDAGADAVAAVLERLWGGAETLIVISSDLSHYLDYDSARAIDARTSEAICTLRPEAISAGQACGRHPIAGLLTAARHHHLHAQQLDLRNSGDTAGPKDRVVGYGAYAFN